MLHRVSGYVCLLAAAASGAVYEVGPGRPLASIGAVPWATLQPGDTVRIHYRSEPYREKWAICRQGTAAAPITVQGVAGPGGELPVIDGNGAVTAPGINFWNDERGLIKIGGCNVPSDTMPRYITIENLEIRNARTSHSFTDDGRVSKAYVRNAAIIYIEKCENCTIRNNVLHDAGNVIFASSPAGSPSRNLLIQGNYIYSGGNTGSTFEHNIYTAAIGITVENNRLGPLLSGATGNSFKDRSAGTVVRYNWIEGGNRQLDLTEGDDNAMITADPSYRTTYVYGNVLIERAGDGNRQIVHYGGDNGTTSLYRKGTLHFFNNTVVSYRTDRNTFFRLSTNEETADVRNNIFYTTLAGTETSLLDETGVLNFSRNWIKPGWRGSFSTSSPIIRDDGTSVNGASPGFVNEAAQDFHPAATSPAVNAGGNLNASVLPAHAVTRQYVKHQTSEARPSNGILDIGAFEAGGGTAPGANQPPVAAMTVSSASGNAPLLVNFSSAGSHDPDGSIATYRWTFGDGAATTGVTASHTYSTAGAFTATLTVTDDKGASASVSRTITTTQQTVAPAAPVLSGSVSGTRITLSWTAPRGVVTGYRLERRANNGSWRLLANTSQRTYSETRARGTSTYRVRAFNAAGNSPWSAAVSLLVR